MAYSQDDLAAALSAAGIEKRVADPLAKKLFDEGLADDDHLRGVTEDDLRSLGFRLRDVQDFRTKWPGDGEPFAAPPHRTAPTTPHRLHTRKMVACARGRCYKALTCVMEFSFFFLCGPLTAVSRWRATASCVSCSLRMLLVEHTWLEQTVALSLFLHCIVVNVLFLCVECRLFSSLRQCFFVCWPYWICSFAHDGRGALERSGDRPRCSSTLQVRAASMTCSTDVLAMVSATQEFLDFFGMEASVGKSAYSSGSDMLPNPTPRFLQEHQHRRT